MKRTVFIGFDERWADAYAVARTSVEKHGIETSGLVLPRLRKAGLYWRPTETRKTVTGSDQLWDVISDAPMATAFSISRFLTPHLARSGWALFMDCDMLVTGDLRALFDHVEKEHADKAVVCVKHNFQPDDRTKMDGQAQSLYARKNWSAFTFYRADHEANRALTVDLVNEVPGRDLHRFCWLANDLIGEIPVAWNWLVNHSDPDIEPCNIHWTDGIPSLPGHHDDSYANRWRDTLYSWAEGALHGR